MPVELVLGVLLRSDSVLLVRRLATAAHFPDRWDFPGGHVEAGESHGAALVRELREELGVAVALPEGDADFAFSVPGTPALAIRGWLLSAWVGEPTLLAPDEHAELAWVQLPLTGERALSHDAYATLLGQDAPVPPATPCRADVRELELVGGPERRKLQLLDYEPRWVAEFLRHRWRILTALSGAAAGGPRCSVQHIGSTSVPGMPAKDIVDVLLSVPDITAEEDYLPPLLAAGYTLRVREPGHRLLRTPELTVHLHILQQGDPAGVDYLLLRDRLRSDPADRALYAATKRELLRQDWADMNDYATAKTAVIEAIKARARAAGPSV